MTIKLTGFTPAFDHLLETHGPIRALVFGKYWRYWAAYGKALNNQENMAAQIGINERTLRNHLKALVKDGYLEDLTPNLKNRPHSYIPTQKLTIEIEARAKLQETDPQQPETPATPDETEPEPETHPESNAGQPESNSGQDTPQPESNAGQPESNSGEDTVKDTEIKETKEQEMKSLFFGGLEGEVKNPRALAALESAAERENSGEVSFPQYPEDIHPLLVEFMNTFGFPAVSIPTSGKNLKDWIGSLREIQTACNGAGAGPVMRKIKETKGTMRVLRPGSILSSIPVALSLLEPETPATQPGETNRAWSAAELKARMARKGGQNGS